MRTVTSAIIIILGLIVMVGVAWGTESPSTGLPATPQVRSTGTDPTAAAQHLEYVFVDGSIVVYDMAHEHRLVKQVDLPWVTRIKGTVADAASGMLYISYGNKKPYGLSGSLLKYDLVADRVIWDNAYPIGVDSMCITPDGRTIYLPSGDFTEGDVWHIVDAKSGQLISDLHVAPYPHNTVCGLSGKRAFLGAPGYEYLNVADTSTNTVIRSIGPLGGGVRPFTVNGRETVAYINVNGLLGFVVADISTGTVLYRVSPEGFGWSVDPRVCPSHGIALSPDEREVWMIDQPNNAVHIFDVTGVPSSAPRMVGTVRLSGALSGHQSSGAEREGWLGFSRDGRYVYVGDAGDVIDASTRKTVASLAPLANTRIFLEIDFEKGVPVFATPRYAIGYVTG